jgi:hypothetical protein
MGVLLPILLLVAYELPDLGQIPAPEAPRASRIERALATIRTGEGPEVDAAVRDLALCGETALPAIVRRLGEAPAGERLLLLAAASPMARAAPLLEQARVDAHPAVRAWATGAPRDPHPPLRDLAERYLDLLAVVEQRAYDKADDDLKPLADPLGRRPESLEVQRRRMKDKDLAAVLRDERMAAARRFARAGAVALARGEMRADLSDPVFVAFTALLREDEDVPYFACVALVKAGAAAAPALEELLDRGSHDPPGRIVRLLCAVRPDGGRGLYDAFAIRRPDAQLALVEIAPDVLEGAQLVDLLESAALEPDESVRTAALDALLELPAPAGRAPAKALLDPQRYGAAEYKRATELLARCGDLEPLELFATLPPAPPGPGPAAGARGAGRGAAGSDEAGEDPAAVEDEGGEAPPRDGEERQAVDPQRLSNLRAAAQTALRGARGDAVEEMGLRLLGAESAGVRTLGIDLVRDGETLLARAREEPADDLARAAVLRLLALHTDTADAAVGILHARGLEVGTPVLQRLLAAGRIDLVVALAAREDAALRILANQPSIDRVHEAALLAIHDGAPAARRRDALAAVVALGTEEARRRCEADTDLALEVLRQRAEWGLPCPFPFPLKRFLEGADGTRLRLLAGAAEGLPSVEPGLFFELFRAWGAVEGPGTEEGKAQERARLFDGVARTDDATSARLFFDLLVAGETRERTLVMGTLMVAAKHLAAEDLVRLLPLLRAQVREERPQSDARPPPPSELRDTLLRGGFNALAHARVEAALDDLCDVVIDPALQPAAFEWRSASCAPYYAIDALRGFPASAVEPAFRRALARAEEDGRLAACDPDDLDYLASVCRTGHRYEDEWWTRGRALYEVALALCDTIERLPGGDAAYGRMLALGGLNRFADAAGAARVAAARRRARGYTALDGYVTPEYLEARGRLYEALAAGDASAIFAAAESADDPFLWNLAAWYLRFLVPDTGLAARAGEAAVRGSAGLHRMYRDTLAAVRNLQGRPREALRLLDPSERTPARRPRPLGNLWHEAYFAEAYLRLGEETAARHALERAVRDRRALPTLRGDPAFARFEDVFRDAEESFFYDTLFAREWE